MSLPILKTLGGLVLLTLGAELLVRGGTALARRGGLSPLVVGLTVVSIGTSLPELVVSVDAALQGKEAIGIGNVVGSNISNIGLILGLAALVRPMDVEAKVVRLDAPILVGASLLLVALLLDGELGGGDGALLTLGAVGYLGFTVWAARRSPAQIHDAVTDELPSQMSLVRAVGIFVLGIGGLLLGAHLLVDGAVRLARLYEVSELVVGLSVVAVGTSLPELATSVMATYRGRGSLAIGNAIGSCILNILGILGPMATAIPLSTAALSTVDLVLMVGLAVLVLPLLRSDYTLGRGEGAGLLILYLGYMAFLFFG
ncbi:calcium/sodium antiporter [Salinibacter sp.]|jgi:cation:H+ antiporter|uniref:calcium/sodium antiporter n=1 Tax=Salinibacter sp. TaxID=2065818 RepID=UPI0021E79506|nr:calcium/sodium antiporter [Salinibacter sp.]